ncbi:hypothetical protein OFB58_24830, partial [Escherichia coli]|nr:hypothetical protein [Escherichia coli]
MLYPKDTSYPLNLASAVVLPLQGVWNAVIFAATTWVVLREEVDGLWKRSSLGRWWERRRRRRRGRAAGTTTSEARTAVVNMMMMGGGAGGGGHGQRGVRLGSDGLP